ncbi:uncharacterized protein Z520_07039 [Fonsecaea multimorphosa CBS 102226]|uniref:Uncharacterized protein n=1 Tax=Fonsecaea multimorphosa CBS 102226 TaxID=1442371 RepID=A0A0D2H545_9EURO|nr:uncharacterized protein Z520_07039 [Fonsecaea multimorphosa CBS 102226]KIX96925.1 hypothetical protein Z520_07039 [Fonsecaea multimorphosa CBS 102226]OAL23123.1 hypothetical protein AYO22_06616 [Fonsecaea multimorphosa]
MHALSFTKALVFGLLATAPLSAGFTVEARGHDVERRYVGSLASMASKVVRAVIPDIERRHHTEAQIAAKEAAKAKGNRARSPQAPDEFGPWDSTEDEFGSWVDKRSPHHTEAQIAAKEAEAKKHQSRSPHHTEAQIAAKEAAKAKGNHARSAQAPDEFGPWDSTEDEFGSWVDKRSPHHTEAQIAAKEAAAKKHESREPHHTEAQIAAKEAAEAKKHQSREPHHTEAQIAAKEAAEAKKGQR